MGSQLNSNTIQFLSDLKYNNNREWFTDNKNRYEEARSDFENFIDALIDRIAEFDPSIRHHTASDCVFRIYRDVRFSKDKSPYKTNMGAHITAAAKRSEIHSRAGYYIHIEPEGHSMLAGGAYLPDAKWLKRIRERIDREADVLKGILSGADFKKYFGGIDGEKLKTAPKDFPKDHPEIELLKHKSFLATHKMDDKALYPFDQFLNEAGNA